MERTFTCNLCEAMCGLCVELDGARVAGLRGDPDDPLSRGHLCPKAVGLRDLLDDPDRLRQPLIRQEATRGEPRRERPFARASWEQALRRSA